MTALLITFGVLLAIALGLVLSHEFRFRREAQRKRAEREEQWDAARRYHATAQRTARSHHRPSTTGRRVS